MDHDDTNRTILDQRPDHLAMQEYPHTRFLHPVVQQAFPAVGFDENSTPAMVRLTHALLAAPILDLTGYSRQYSRMPIDGEAIRLHVGNREISPQTPVPFDQQSVRAGPRGSQRRGHAGRSTSDNQHVGLRQVRR